MASFLETRTCLKKTLHVKFYTKTHPFIRKAKRNLWKKTTGSVLIIKLDNKYLIPGFKNSEF